MADLFEARHGAKCPKNPRNAKPGARCKGLRGCGFRGIFSYDGKLHRSTKATAGVSLFRSKTDAERWSRTQLAELEAGRSVTQTTATLGELWDGWYDGAKAGRITERGGSRYQPGTLKKYRADMNRLLKEHRDFPVRKITSIWLRERLNEIGAGTDKRKPLSASTARATRTVLQAIFRDSEHVIPGGIHPNPAVGLPSYRTRPDPDAPPKARWSRALVEHRLNALPEDERMAWALYFYAGLRQGEARALRWSDIDWSDLDQDDTNAGVGLIHVRATWDQDVGRKHPKSQAAVRRVPIIEPLVDAITAHEQRTALKHLGSSEGSVPGDWLVTGRTPTEPFNLHTQRNRADKAWERAKLNRITPHDGRRAYAAMMLGTGTIPMSVLSSFMGHASIELTVKLYGDLTTTAEQDAVAAFARYANPDLFAHEAK